jgi:AcrR family transcriptional regulator
MTGDIKNTILQKALLLFFRYGLKSVTMDDIARELAISKKTLYQFFENKNDLLTQIMEIENEKDATITCQIIHKSSDALDELLGHAQHAIGELSKLMSSSTMIYDFQKYYREIWSKFENEMNNRIYEGTKNNIERGIREGLYRADVDADIIAKLYVSKMMCFVDEDMFPSKKYDKVKLFKQYLIYHIHGIATAKGLKKLEERINAFVKSE